MTFPAEPVPDNALTAPHHFLWSLYLALLATAVVWDDWAHREPFLTTLFIVLALFAWFQVWRWYPAAGATLVLVSLAAAILSVLLAISGVELVFNGWAAYPLKWRVFVLLMLLVSLDDAVSHAFGVWTPLDAIWNRYLVPHL